MLLGWIHALGALAENAQPRIRVFCDSGVSSRQAVSMPTQLGCLRFGSQSLSCQAGGAIQADRAE